jgi:hypothetical protein
MGNRMYSFRSIGVPKLKQIDITTHVFCARCGYSAIDDHLGGGDVRRRCAYIAGKVN